MALESEQREILEEVVHLLESVRESLGQMDSPDFEDGRVDAHVVTALSAARAALNVGRGGAAPWRGGEPGR